MEDVHDIQHFGYDAPIVAQNGKIIRSQKDIAIEMTYVSFILKFCEATEREFCQGKA